MAQTGSRDTEGQRHKPVQKSQRWGKRKSGTKCQMKEGMRDKMNVKEKYG